jgi:hypothetical protein
VDRPIEVEIDMNHDVFAGANLERSLRVDVDLLQTVQRYVGERIDPGCIGLNERQRIENQANLAVCSTTSRLRALPRSC